MDKLHRIISNLPISIGAKTITIDVKVVDAANYYNILLRYNWMYAMNAVMYLVFKLFKFPHEDRIVTILTKLIG